MVQKQREGALSDILLLDEKGIADELTTVYHGEMACCSE
jgi:hypothetical protein